MSLRSFSAEDALERLRDRLWRYLSDRARYTDVPGVVSALTGLTEDESSALLSDRLAGSRLAGAMLTAVQELERALPSVVGQARVELIGEAEGEVDWAETERRRINTGEPSLFICTPTRRQYESAQSRLLATCLDHYAAISSTRSGVGSAETVVGTLGARIADRHHIARHLRSRAKLRDARVLSNWPEDRLSRFEHRDQLKPCLDYLRWVRDGIDGGDLEVARQVLEEALLRPSTDAELFEYEIGFCLVDALERRGFVRGSLQAVIRSSASTGPQRLGQRPFAALKGPDGDVFIWRQRAFGTLDGLDGPSLYGDTLRANVAGKASSLKPDWIIEFGSAVIPVEVKLYKDPRAGVAQGLVDTLAYAADRLDLVLSGRMPAALVVVWGTVAEPADTHPILIASEASLDAAVQRILDVAGNIATSGGATLADVFTNFWTEEPGTQSL